MSVTILQGDCRATLPNLPSKSVHCCVTSPPYWGLRDYGLAPVAWPATEYAPLPGLSSVSIPAMECCYGLESTIDAFIAHTVLIGNELHRVLRDDGTLWMNFGDAYNGAGLTGGTAAIAGTMVFRGKQASGRIKGGLKQKDMLGIPWRVAFALQAAGWYLRSDIIWHKKNPMPESVYDRPTKAHEYLFLLSKQPRYFYDAEAIKEAVSGTAQSGGNGLHTKINVISKNSRFRVNRDPANIAKGPRQNRSFSAAVFGLVSTRNKRTVWSIATKAYKQAHFATYPPDLITPCILAGTSEGGCCATCGTPLERVIEKGEPDRVHQRACGGDENGEYHGKATKEFGAARAQDASATKARILAGMVERKTIGWNKTCKCVDPAVVPCTVLDPFAGSGTTGQVAQHYGRNAVLCEANPDYIKLIEQRIAIPLEKPRTPRRSKPQPHQSTLAL